MPDVLRRNDCLFKEAQENENADQYACQCAGNYGQPFLRKNLGKQIVFTGNKEEKSKYENNEFFHFGKKRRLRSAAVPSVS